MISTNLGATLILCLVFSLSSQQQELDLKTLNDRLRQQCFNDRKNNTNDPNEITCNRTYDVACWPETKAGDSFIQDCPFLLFRSGGKISRRCDEQGNWQEMNISNCRRLTPKEAVEKGKQEANIPSEEKHDSVTHLERVQRVYVAISWIAFFVLLPSLIVICIVIGRENERFTIHKNLILTFILRHITLFIYYYENMGEKDFKTSVCNAFWLLNRYFTASEITWMLNEGIFLLRMLVYPFDNESYLWYYFLFGWGFSGVLTFCVYLPYMQFKIARVSAGCWAWGQYSHSSHMLVLYVPLTIMLLINFVIAAYVIQMLARKLKNSSSTQMNRIKKSAKAITILISLLGLIYLLVFYLPGDNPSSEYFVAVIYPLQGIMVCIFCVFLSSEFREALKRHWMKWRYGIEIETNPYATGRDNEAGPSGEQEGTSASMLRTESSETVPPRALSIASLRDKSSGQLSKEASHRRNSHMSLLSRSSDLTRFRLAKIEPEPMVPLRVQSVGPGDWVPPTLQAVKAWGVIDLPKNPDEPTASERHANEGFSGSHASLAGHKNSLYSAKPETEPVESQTTSLVEPETKPEDREESGRSGEPNNTAKDDTRENSTPQQFEDQFSPFSSQLFEHEDEVYKESPSSSPVASVEPATSGGETPTATAGSSSSQDAEPSTSAEDSNASSQGKGFWDKARLLASQRRRSRIEHNKVLSNNDDSSQLRHTDRFKQADEYRMAWIANILRGSKLRDNESEA